MVGVHSGGGRKKGGPGVRSEPRSILASPAGWTRPDIAFRSSPSRRYQATLPTSHPSTPSTPAAGPSFFLPFVSPLPLGRPALSASPRDLHPSRRAEAFAGKKIFCSAPKAPLRFCDVPVVLAKCEIVLIDDEERELREKR